jgi:hypothetical protein
VLLPNFRIRVVFVEHVTLEREYKYHISDEFDLMDASFSRHLGDVGEHSKRKREKHGKRLVF